MSVKQRLKSLVVGDYKTLNLVELNRRRVQANIDLIRGQNPGTAIIPVIKANAYGHGLAQIAKILNDADCAFVAVDGYFEAARIRRLTKHPILVMGYIGPENFHLLDTKRCSFVIQDIAGLKAMGQLRRPAKIHLELDTGMHRLGLTAKELDEYLEVIKQYPNLKLEGVMTHLADADNEHDDFTFRQVREFDEGVERVLSVGFKPRFFHIAQTAGSTKVRSRYANAIRLGIGLYGINPLSPGDKHFKDLAGLQPVLKLKSTIIKTYDLKKGDKVSYNGIFTAPAKMRIGVLPLGYYEGVPRELSNNGCVTRDGKALPIVGRVCMNHTIIDLTGTDLGVGDGVTVISDDPAQPNSVQQMWLNQGIFAYSLPAKLSADLRRTVV